MTLMKIFEFIRKTNDIRIFSRENVNLGHSQFVD